MKYKEVTPKEEPPKTKEERKKKKPLAQIFLFYLFLKNYFI